MGHVHKLHIATGSQIVHSSTIAATFWDYYAQLYHLPDTLPGSTVDQKQDSILQYLAGAQTSQLTAQISKQLEMPITQTELETVVKELLKGKSPGPDRYTNAYYSAYLPLLSNPMCVYFNALASGTAIPKEGLLAISWCSLYCP